MSMDPGVPMKIRAGWKLCGRNPRHMPTRIAEASAGAASSDSPSTLVIE